MSEYIGIEYDAAVSIFESVLIAEHNRFTDILFAPDVYYSDDELENIEKILSGIKVILPYYISGGNRNKLK